MFKILSKESNIFSIPVYIGILLLGIIGINYFEFNALSIISTIIAFIGVSLGYFTFNSIALNHKTHLPLFLYTAINIALYPNMLDIGISWTILSNALFIWILSNKEENSKQIYVLVGALFTINYIFLPSVWPMLFFFIFHIFGTTKRVALNLFRFFFGAFLIGTSYFSIAYFLDLDTWNTNYLPRFTMVYSGIGEELFYLTPLALLMIYAVLDYFIQHHKISAKSKFKYIFLLLFILAQLIVIILYMGTFTQYLLIIALPVSIIISRALYYMTNKTVQEVGIWLILISLATYRLFQYIQF